MLDHTANRSAKRRYPSPNAADYNELEPPRVPLFSMPLTQSRKIIRFPYNSMLSTKQDTPRPTKRVKWNKEPAHWRTTAGDFVDGTTLHPSSSSSSDNDDDTDHIAGSGSVSGLNNTSASSDGSTASSDLIMLDGSPCSSKAELVRLQENKRQRAMGPLSEPALYQTIDEAVARTLKRRLVPYLNKVEEMVHQNAAEALERMRERIRISYQLDYEKLEEQVRKTKRVCKEREREIERLVREREGGYWGEDGDGVDAAAVVGAVPEGQGGEGEKKGEEMAVERVRRMFLEFRAKVWEFVCSSALQLETKAKVTEVDIMRLPWVPDQQLFGNASVEVRRYLVMAAVFQVLYSRILRPGHRTFGAERDGEVDERGETGRVERQLEDIEGYLMRHEKLGQKSEAKWRAVNINLFKQLRNGVMTVEAKSAAQTLIGYLEPLMKFTFARNKKMVEKTIEQLCEQAVDLKLAIRKSPVPLRIEIAPQSTDEEDDEDAPEWEPKMDKTGKPLLDPRWHEKMGQLKLTTEEREVSTKVKYIAFIPFGALARCEPNGLKMVVERAWAIGRA